MQLNRHAIERIKPSLKSQSFLRYLKQPGPAAVLGSDRYAFDLFFFNTRPETNIRVTKGDYTAKRFRKSPLLQRRRPIRLLMAIRLKTDVDLVGRMMSMGTLHKSYAVSGPVPTVGAAMILGTDAHQKEMLSIGHPGGIIEVGAAIEKMNGTSHYREVVLGRTARRLMEGNVLVFEQVLQRPLKLPIESRAEYSGKNE